MNLTWIDWTIVCGLIVSMVGCTLFAKRYMRSVADFLAAGRTAGRYLISIAQGMAGLGAITIVGYFEMNYIAGFSMTWWGFTTAVVVMVITVSGWVIYRFRQTRCMTLAQFFEKRYSKRFRVFAGILAFFSGIINFGIFPAVGARFFIYFCGLPHSFSLLGLEIGTFPLIMLVLLGCSLYFVFVGGQISVIITEFFQGVFVNVVFLIILFLFLFKFDWNVLLQGVSAAPADASLINPFHTSQVDDFNFWYFLIGIIGVIYNTMSWQGTQGYNTSAKSAHEAKMGSVLSNWRGIPQTIALLFIPLVAYVVMHHQQFLSTSGAVNGVLSAVPTTALKSQLTVPLVLTHLLPKGLMGAFAAVILAAFISNHGTYLHSWSSILVQDVIMPFRKEAFKPEQHIRVLRYSLIAVAIFIFCFSLIFQNAEYIFLFFAITAAIYAGGSGAVIIGGLYWKRGTTAAAWTAMITGSVIAVGGIVILQINPDFPINGQLFWGLAMAVSSVLYVAISLLGRRSKANLDEILKRGPYAVKSETTLVETQPERGFKIFGMGKEFTRGDKFIYIATYAWTFMWIVTFIIGTIYNLTFDVSDAAWLKFWYVYLWINAVIAVVVVVWFSIGGLKDLRIMFSKLATMERDHQDSGYIKSEQLPERES